MISWLLHEYKVKPSTSVNNYDIIRVKVAFTMIKETGINIVLRTHFILQSKIDIL